MGMHPYGEPQVRGQDPRDDRDRRGRQPVAGHVLLRLPALDRQHAGASASASTSGGRRAIPSWATSRSTPTTATWRASIQKVTEEVVLKMARHRARADGLEAPVHGRRRGAQLGRQLQGAAQRAVRGALHPARARRRRRLGRRGLLGLQPPARPAARPGARPRLPRQRVLRRRDRELPEARTTSPSRRSRTTSASTTSPRSSWPRAWSAAGSAGASSSARARSVRARSSPTRAARR